MAFVWMCTAEMATALLRVVRAADVVSGTVGLWRRAVSCTRAVLLRRQNAGTPAWPHHVDACHRASRQHPAVHRPGLRATTSLRCQVSL